MTEGEKLRFEICLRQNLALERESGKNIGTYKEKRMHRILKSYFEPDESLHEVAVGKYVADIARENEIIEIQTGSFYPMQEKLRYYLEETELSVTVVRPLPHIKWCVWLDPESGEIKSKKKSNKRYMPKDVMRDWVYLSDFIGNKRLKIVFLLLEEEEYRFLSGWSKDKKRGSRRYERMPLALIDSLEFSSPEDYLCFLPEGLGESFTASEYMRAAKLRSYAAYGALKILCALGFLEREKSGRAYVYYKK